jgi:beta-lactamase superfamily II metal-dependent hydrolase
MISTLIASVAFLLGLIFGEGQLVMGDFSGYIEEWTRDIRHWFEGIERPSASESTEEAMIHVFDVGQGSAMLLQADGTNILIDTGRFDDSSKRILHYLDREIGTGGTIDLLIFTHNDADHIGHGELVLEYYSVEEVWMNGMDHTTATYTRVLDAMLDADVEYLEPKAGYEKEVGPFWIEVFHPLEDEVMYNQNEESIVTRFTVNDLSFMNTGDVSYDVEDRIINDFAHLTSEIMVVGHHGSRYSTGRNWIEALDPEIAIYQAAEENMYGHPHEEVELRLNDVDVPLYGTAEHGTITIIIDAEGEYVVETEREGD